MKYNIVLLLMLFSCVSNKEIIITEFYTDNVSVYKSISQTGKEIIYYNNFFLVSNYSSNNKIEKKLDSFVLHYTLEMKYSDNLEEARLWFYKESSRTNLISISQNPKEIDRYSNDHDLVYCYIIKGEGERIRERYKNGEVIETTEKFSKPSKFNVTNFMEY